MMLLGGLMRIFTFLIFALVSADAGQGGPDQDLTDPQKARLLIAKASWGIASSLQHLKAHGSENTENDKNIYPYGNVLSFADYEGSIFFYLMGKHNSQLALSVTEASLPPYDPNLAMAACGARGDKDAEDPRCAKLTITGKLQPCTEGDLCDEGYKALAARHPEMTQWPKGHNFVVHSMKITDIWMLANYGGQSLIHPNDYYDAHIETVSRTGWPINAANKAQAIGVPSWNKKAQRARWIVENGLWMTVSTISSRLNGTAWGNVRSMVDGNSANTSTGKPVFYLPTPDATFIDIAKNPRISITISEASLAARLTFDGKNVCEGMDPENPLCARVSLTGTAKNITSSNDLKQVQKAFAKRHPLAPWLADGGSHTGGSYFTIDLEQVVIFDYFGGGTEVTVEDYLSANTTTSIVKNEMMLRGNDQ